MNEAYQNREHLDKANFNYSLEENPRYTVYKYLKGNEKFDIYEWSSWIKHCWKEFKILNTSKRNSQEEQNLFDKYLDNYVYLELQKGKKDVTNV